MIKSGNSLFFLIFVLTLTSCATEKYNVSPVNSSLSRNSSSSNSVSEKYYNKFEENTNAAEITNIISNIPNFNNKIMDKEVLNLKMNLTNYLYAVEAFNIAGKQRYLKAIEFSYKNIQSLRKKLTPEQSEVLNRYLVRIKTNITVIESEFAQNNYH